MFNNPPQKRRLSILQGTPAQIICLSFLGVILAGTVLLMLPISTRNGVFTSFSDALFTATSATCVTGLIVHDTYLYWSGFGQFVIILLIQIGGLGLVTFGGFFTLGLGRKLGLRSMDLVKESASTDSFADVKRMVRTIFGVTFAIEAIGAVVLCFTSVPIYGLEGIAISAFLSISAFCNAGFDLMGREGEYASLMHYVSEPQVYLPIALLVVFGGLGFVVWRELFRYREDKKLSLHSRLVLIVTGGFILAGTIAFLVFEWNNPNTMQPLSLADKLGAGFFQSVSCRTAGFNTIDQAGLSNESKLTSIVLMFIGAAPASTGGGIKITTIAVVVMTVVSVLRGYDDTVIMRRKVDSRSVYKAIALLLLGLLVVTVCSLVIYFALDADQSAIDVVFEEVSAFGTVGLSAGITAKLGAASRYMLILSMFLGRVGLLSLAISLTLRTGSNKEVLPQGKIIIG